MQRAVVGPHGAGLRRLDDAHLHVLGEDRPYHLRQVGHRFAQVFARLKRAPNSVRALANLYAICRKHFPESHRIELVDVAE